MEYTRYTVCHDCGMDTDDWVIESRTTGDMGMGSGQYTYSDFPVHNDRRLCRQFSEMKSRIAEASGRDYWIQAKYNAWQEELQRAQAAKDALLQPLKASMPEGEKRPRKRSTRVWQDPSSLQALIDG